MEYWLLRLPVNLPAFLWLTVNFLAFLRLTVIIFFSITVNRSCSTLIAIVLRSEILNSIVVKHTESL